MMSIMALRAESQGPMGFSLASMWMPRLGSAKLGRAAQARCDSVMGKVARAEAPAAKRKKERREMPLQAGSEIGDLGVAGICVNSFGGGGEQRPCTGCGETNMNVCA